MSGTKLHTEATGFTVLDHDGNTSSCHENSTLRCLNAQQICWLLCFAVEELPVMDITFVCEPAHTGGAACTARNQHSCNAGLRSVLLPTWRVPWPSRQCSSSLR